MTLTVFWSIVLFLRNWRAHFNSEKSRHGFVLFSEKSGTRVLRQLNMVPVREMPKKSLPFSLLLDLRRRGIRVPMEIQMRIMYLKEVVENRDIKDWAMMQIRGTTVCGVFKMAHDCGEYGWRSRHRRVQNLRMASLNIACHWCNKCLREMLTIGMRAQLSRPDPDLNQLHSEACWLAEEIYRQRSVGEPVGTHLRQVNRRGPAHNTVDELMKWTVSCIHIVDLITDMNLLMSANE